MRQMAWLKCWSRERFWSEGSCLRDTDQRPCKAPWGAAGGGRRCWPTFFTRSDTNKVKYPVDLLKKVRPKALKPCTASKRCVIPPHIEELYCPIEIKIVASTSACSLLMCYLRGAMRAIISPRREFNYKPWFGRAWSMRANTLGAGLKA